MSAVQQFHDLTVQLIKLLESSADRDEKIAKTTELLEKRQQLMSEMIPPFSNEEKEIGAAAITLNKKLNDLLYKEKILIQKDIKELSRKKESTNKYENPYNSLLIDGMFYDKRK
ncbi:flagellar protein FliT [Bacillus methanolicus]|uniref:flagellar protein FliT n=1 Tax=Bacillus methanolicus TaxID=1471 RepID=UPI00238054FF|nr:flagellar protein FliT [Bacillus methanolicus]MDE3840136.1 flagellar protein FliT [Bacillus methanolicus]